ncbi:protein NLP2-like isoform X1 [Camellia sinensis]|uniref:protein NLP2-like isoform X1 n=1 Tax=Camellia sinensis TaxID=4442 RepID=UPI001035C563|nr:protein NLP2-like isoform X1 [Camellia sinensis]XP_028091690.1 protein NLP2-like isoform X1 [Camellia sinensis]
MMLLLHGAGEGGGIHEGGGRGDEGMDRDGYQDLETEIKSWQPEDRNSGVFCSYAADNSDLIPKSEKWELKDEIKCVVGKVFNSSRIDALLVQYWAPITTDGEAILTTQNQPFALSKIYKGLCWYRMISKDYKFYVDGGATEQQLGLPGRVFKHQLVESSPNVEYYSNKEYPQLEHALSCQIRSALALPVFEPADHTCVGVLELLFTTRDAFLIFLEEACAYDAFLEYVTFMNLHAFEMFYSIYVNLDRSFSPLSLFIFG